MDSKSRILVLGAGGMVGSAVIKALKIHGYHNFTEHVHTEWSSTDLTKMQSVQNIFAKYQPEYVFLCAAKAGGIKANNDFPVQFLEVNLSIQNNVIRCCHESKIKRLIFLGSSCVYPKSAPQPMSESALLSGSLEPTNSAYAIAKIAGIELCKSYNKQYGSDFISVMPCNLYGDNDRYDGTGHVIPMLISKIKASKQTNSDVDAWGTGSVLREFMHADDLADCLVRLMACKDKLPELINIGSGEEVFIKTLVERISDILSFNGKINWSNSVSMDGPGRKILDSSLLRSILPNWQPGIKLYDGLASVIKKLG